MPAPIILVTGSTDGIGKAAATALVRQGYTVIIHGRDGRKAERVRQELATQATGMEPAASIADFTDLDQVRTMALEVLFNYSRLDVLVNNAGTYRKTREITREGTEVTFAVNYVAPVLLTHLLLPLLRKSSPARIVTMTSAAHEDIARIDWDNLPGMPRYEPWQAYALSKFADLAFTLALARRLTGSGVTANCLHPGVVNTKLLREAFPKMKGISPEEGAKTLVYLATSADVASLSGTYFENNKPVQPSALSRDRNVQDQLGKLAEDLTGLSGR